jgi:hypothetical protein
MEAASAIRPRHLRVLPAPVDVPPVGDRERDRLEVEGLLEDVRRHVDAIADPFLRSVLLTWQTFLERTLRSWRW